MGASATKVIIDANICISFLLTQNEAISEIFQKWLLDEFIVYISPDIIAEVNRVCGYPKIKQRLIVANQHHLIWLFDNNCQTIYPTKTITFKRDPNDAKYLEAALESEADYLVTGDKDLLDLGHYRKTKIITPREYVEILRK